MVDSNSHFDNRYLIFGMSNYQYDYTHPYVLVVWHKDIYRELVGSSTDQQSDHEIDDDYTYLKNQIQKYLSFIKNTQIFLAYKCDFQ